MSKKIGFLQRWMFIIDKINSHPYISKEELESAVENELHMYDGVEDIGIRSRTIERDLNFIRYDVRRHYIEGLFSGRR